jgi:hypothetical protein
MDALSRDDAGGDHFDAPELLRVDRTLAVDRLADGGDDPS